MAEEVAGKAENVNDKSENDEDSGITMVDVLEEEKELEDDANAVLGGSDDQNCTYPQGYVKRQALYACKTCSGKENGEGNGGICLACSYACHEGHELVELYTKRNFCCDCGNSKFPNNPCKLYPNKSTTNNRNKYNKNFRGVYCVCSRPYPDPEDEVEDEMIQCIICEDWYHGRHLGSKIPSGDDYEEMICSECMSTCDVLWPYTRHSIATPVECEDSNDSALVDVQNFSTDETQDSGEKEKLKSPSSEESSCSSFSIVVSSSQEDSAFCSDPSDFTCKLRLLSQPTKTVRRVTFWPAGWREKICSCDNCKAAFKEKGLQYLFDLQDTVHSYEEQGKAKQSGQSQYDQGMQALSRLDRIRQVEAIHEYNSMKSHLKDYLKSFAEKKQVVRKEDIDEFFTQMRERKRRRLNVNVPNFCR